MKTLSVLGWSGIGLLYVPLLAVAVASFNAGRHGVAWKGFTVDWYVKLLGNQVVAEATVNTLLVAGISTIVATVLGTLLALGLARTPWPRPVRGGLDVLIHLPVVTPDIILAAALVVAFAVLRLLGPLAEVWFAPGLLQIIIGHITFEIPFVALIVMARLTMIGRSQEEAARDLYASTWRLYTRVLLPQLAPAIAAGALLAFSLSLDDFIIAFFTCGPGTETLPVLIYGQMARGVSPELHALSTLIFVATVLLVVGAARLQGSRAAAS
ncbi:spermidine/putrescine ABC transporter permease [Planctomycetota bacterium]|nr:spermidine/putrescine ABC transporter permease [Planctomycetota bacterium]